MIRIFVLGALIGAACWLIITGTIRVVQYVHEDGVAPVYGAWRPARCHLVEFRGYSDNVCEDLEITKPAPQPEPHHLSEPCMFRGKMHSFDPSIRLCPEDSDAHE